MTLYIVTGKELNGLTHGNLKTRSALRKYIKNRTLSDPELCVVLNDINLKDKANHISFDELRKQGEQK